MQYFDYGVAVFGYLLRAVDRETVFGLRIGIAFLD
jgi:hypothetical protein